MLERLQAELKDAQLARDKLKVQTLKSLKAALQNERIEQGSDLNEDQQLQVVGRELKKRKEAAEMYQNAGRTDQAETELAEIEILEEYLPNQLNQTEIVEIIQTAIDEVNATSISDMGKVMAAVSSKLTGRADKGEVAATVKDILSA